MAVLDPRPNRPKATAQDGPDVKKSTFINPLLIPIKETRRLCLMSDEPLITGLVENGELLNERRQVFCHLCNKQFTILPHERYYVINGRVQLAKMPRHFPGGQLLMRATIGEDKL